MVKTKTTTTKMKIAKTATPPTATVTKTKKTKQQKVIALRTKYPDMANKDIATKVGCNATYVSQILRSGTTTTAAKRRARTATPTDTQTLLTAYHDMQCIVKRVGTCSAKTLLEDITNGTT